MQMLHLGFASGVHHNAVPPLRAPYETCPSYTTSCFLISACGHSHQKTTSSLALHGYLSTTADSAHAVQRNLKKETTLHAQPSVCSDVHTQKHRAQEVSHLLKKTDHVSLACAGVAQTLEKRGRRQLHSLRLETAPVHHYAILRIEMFTNSTYFRRRCNWAQGVSFLHAHQCQHLTWSSLLATTLT